jgi:lysophospholipase L1-like esterase
MHPLIRPLAACAISSVTLATQSAPAADPAPGAVAPPAEVRILLPERIPAVPGIEANIYFDNVFLARNMANYSVDVNCRKGIQQEERWTFTPTEQDLGPHPFSLVVRDASNKEVARAESVIEVLPKDAGKDREISLLTIGDSLTQPLLYQARLLDLCKPDDNPKIRLIGHCPSDEYPNFRTEGYGGWTAERFATHFRPGPRQKGDWRVWNDSGSPFLYPDASGKPRLDFAQFCREFNEGRAPDMVTIFLGINDMLTTSDDALEAALDKMLVHYDALIAMIRKTSSTTQIGVVLPPPPAASQDAFGENFQCELTRWQYRQRHQRLLERLTATYGNREAESVFLIPVHANLDCRHNYPSVTVPANAHTKTEIVRLNNAVHPAHEGQQQIGDTIFSWIKARLKGD